MPDEPTSTTPATTTPTAPAPAAATAAEPAPSAARTETKPDDDTVHAKSLRDFVRADPSLRKIVKKAWYEKNKLPTPKDDPDFADEKPAETAPADDAGETVQYQLADAAHFASLGAGDPIAGEQKWNKEYGPHVDRALAAIVRGNKDPRTARMQMLGFLKRYAELEMGAAKATTTTTPEPDPSETSGERSTGGGGAVTSKDPEDIYEAFRQAKKEHGVTRLAELMEV